MQISQTANDKERAQREHSPPPFSVIVLPKCVQGKTLLRNDLLVLGLTSFMLRCEPFVFEVFDSKYRVTCFQVLANIIFFFFFIFGTS